MSENEQQEPDVRPIQAPPLLLPGQRAHESAYRASYDLLTQSMPQDALGLLEPALEEEPHNTGLLSLRAWAFLQRAQLQKAETDLLAVVEVDPTNSWARHALGRALERQSRYQEALPHLRLAAVMSDDYDHQAAVYRVEQQLTTES